jgi:hypothetical protein
MIVEGPVIKQEQLYAEVVIGGDWIKCLYWDCISEGRFRMVWTLDRQY